MENGGTVSPKSRFDPKMVDDELRVTLPTVFVVALVAKGSNVTPFTVAPEFPTPPKLYAETDVPRLLMSLSPVIVCGLLQVTNPARAGIAASRLRAMKCGSRDRAIRVDEGTMGSGVIIGEYRCEMVNVGRIGSSTKVGCVKACWR